MRIENYIHMAESRDTYVLLIEPIVSTWQKTLWQIESNLLAVNHIHSNWRMMQCILQQDYITDGRGHILESLLSESWIQE